MLDNLRNFGRSWVAKLFLGILIIAVAGFGIPSVFLDLNANTVARVGDQNISTRDFDSLYRIQISQFAQQTGMAPTAQQSVAFGIPNSVLARLASDASVEILGQRLGLGVSDARLAQIVRQDPNFVSALGTFDPASFSLMLRQSGYTEAEYLNLQRKTANREQIGSIFTNAKLPQVALDLARAYETDQRSIEYVTLNPVLFEVSEDPTEEELTQFFNENQSLFRTVETRRVRLLPLTAEALAEGVTVSEAEIAAEYERTAAQYVAPERRTLHELVLPDDAAEAAFEAGVAEGRTFASVVTETGLQTAVTDLGTLSEAEIADPALASAFLLPENGYAVVGERRVVWVSAIDEGGQQPLEAVREEVERSARTRKAQDMLFEVYDAIEDSRAAFLPIADVAATYGLEVYDVDLTRDGAALNAIPVLPSGSSQTIVNAVFNAAEDAPLTPAINLGSNRTVFFEIEEVLPARDQTLDEVRAAAILSWRAVQSDLAMTEAAEAMVAAIDAGSDLFTVAAENGQIPEVSAPFGRDSAGSPVDPDVVAAAFQGGEGYANYVSTQSGDVVVFQVTAVIPASADAPTPFTDAVESTFPDVLYASFVEGLRQDAGIRINEEALNRVIGLE